MKLTVDDGVLGRDVALRLPAVTDDERVVHVVAVTPPPAFHVLEPLEVFRLAVRALVPGQGQHERGRVVRRRRRTRLCHLFGRAAVEHLEAGDEFAFALGAVRAQARVLGVREERDGPDVVRGGPTRRESVGRLVPGAGLELGNATFRIGTRGGRGESAFAERFRKTAGGRRERTHCCIRSGTCSLSYQSARGVLGRYQSALSAFTRDPVGIGEHARRRTLKLFEGGRLSGFAKDPEVARSGLR